MKIGVNIIWGAFGILIALLGFSVWKKFFKAAVRKIEKLRLSDSDGFIEFFGKSIVFLGMLTLASAIICFKSIEYFSVSLVLNALAVLYFILETRHLLRKYKEKS